MADVNANIGVHIDTSATIAQLKALRAEISRFNQSVSKSSAAAAIAQRDLQTNLLNSINATGKFHARMGLVRTSTEAFTHALETNKLTMGQYFKYAGGATNTFRKLFTKEFDTISQVAQDRVKRMQTQYIKLGRDASGAMKAISITPTSLNMKDYGTQVALAAQRQALFNQLLKQGSTNLLNFGKNTQWAGRQLMVGFTIPLAYLGTAAAKTFMAIEEQAIKFKRVYGEMFTTNTETNKALEEVRRLAEEFTKYGVAVEKTIELAAKAAATGKVGADLMAQVQSATRLAVLGGVEQEQALDTTISLTNAFGIAAEDLAQKINFLNAVENQTVVSIEDLTIAIPKAGPVIKQLGGSVEDLAFFLTAMKEGGINASEGANALKSGLASLINPTDKASKMLAEMGINITGIVEANKGNVKGIVLDFAAALDTLDPLNRARAIEQLFGKFQFARLSTLFSNVSKEGTQAARVLDLTAASVEELAILSERELKTVEDAIGVNFKEAVQKLRLALEPIGKVFLQTITPIAQTIASLLDKFNNLGDGTKKFIVIATALVGIIGPTFLMTFGLLANAVANIIKLFGLMRGGFLRLKGQSTVLAEQTNYLTMEQREAATVAAALDQAHNKLTQRFTSEAVALEQLRAAFDRATAAQTRFAASNPGMMVPGFKGANLPGKKFAGGTTEVVGGQAGKDSVPALLMPGEAVVPTDIAQDEKFKPLIAALVTGKINQYGDGTGNAGSQGRGVPKTSTTVFFDFDDTLAKSTSAIEQWKAQNGLTGKTTAAMYEAFNADVAAGRVKVPIIPENVQKLKALQQAGVDVRILTARNANEVNLASLKEVLKSNGITIADDKITLNASGSKDSVYKADEIKKFLKNNPGSRAQLIDDNLENVRAVRNLSSAKELQKRFGAVVTAAAVEDAKFVQTKDGRLGINFQGRTYPVSTESMAQKIVTRLNDDLRNASSQAKKQEIANWATKRFSEIVDDRPGGKNVLDSMGRVFRKDRGRGGVTYDVRKALNAFLEKSSYENALGAAQSQEQRAVVEALKKYNLTDKQLKQALQMQASHIWPSEDENGRRLKFDDPMKWKRGHVLDDMGILNNYLNRVGPDAKGRLSSFQDLAVRFLADKQLSSGLNTAQLQADLAWAKLGKHPTSLQEIASLRRISELDMVMNKAGVYTDADVLRRLGFKGNKSEITKFSKLAGNIYQADGVNALTKGRGPAWASGLAARVLDLASMKSVMAGGAPVPGVNVQKGELILTEDGWKKATGQTTTPARPGTTVGGGSRDTRTPKGPVSAVFNPRLRRIGAQDEFNVGPSKTMGTTTAQQIARERRISLTEAKKLLKAEQSLNIERIKNTKVTDDSGKATSQKTKLDQQQLRQQRYDKLSRVGSPVAMAAGTAAMAGAMMGAPEGFTKMMLGVSVISGLLPLMANPWMIAVAAVVGLGAVIMKFNSDLKKAREAGRQLADAMTMSAKDVEELGTITGKVSASEIMNRRRQNILAGGITEPQRQFGQNVMQSEFGKKMLGGIETMTKSGMSPAQVAQNVSTQLGQAIMQGVITPEQAKSIASALGEQLGSYEIPLNISGKINTLFGPNGENLKDNPLQVALEVKKESMKSQADAFQAALNARKAQSTDRGRANALGAGAGATIGVGILSANPFIIAAGIGMGVKAQADFNKLKAESLKLDTAAIQLGIESVAQGQDLIDSINVRYDRLVAEAKTQSEINQLEIDRKKAIEDINTANAESLKTIIAQRDQMSSGAFEAAIKAQADMMYKEGPMAVFKDQALESLKSLQESDFKAQMQLGFASGEIDPLTLISILKMASNNENIQKNLQFLITTEGFADMSLLSTLLNTVSQGDQKTFEFLLNYVNTNGETFDADMEAIRRIADFKGAYDVTLDMKTNGAGKIQAVNTALKQIEELPEKITKEALVKANTEGQFNDIIANWYALSEGKDQINKNLIVNYRVGSIDPNIQNAATAAGQSVPEYLAKGFVAPTPTKPTTTTTPKTPKGRDTTLDELLKRLKFIRKASIDAEKGVGELMRVTAGKGITKFGGVMQQLMAGPKGGFNREFISFLEGMDNATRKTYMTVKNGQVILTKQGKALKEAFNEKVIGEFQVAQVQAIQDTKAQSAALIKLQNAGVDSATALAMVADANLAVAINSKNISSTELQNMATQAQEAKNQVRALNLELSNTVQTMTERGQELDETIKVIAKIKEINPRVSSEFLQALASDKSAIQGFYDSFFKGAQNKVPDLKKYIDQYFVNNAAEIKLKISLDPNFAVQQAQEAFDKISSGIEKYLSAQRAQITRQIAPPTLMNQLDKNIQSAQDAVTKAETNLAGIKDATGKTISDYQSEIDNLRLALDAGLEIEIRKLTNQIKAEQDKIAAEFDKPIEGLRHNIEEIQRGIELNFTRPIEELNKQIEDIQRDVELNFERPIAALQEESSDLANELTLMDKVAESINKKYDDQAAALQKVADINQDIAEQQKGQLDLASALSRGDVAAAARAAQEMRAQAAAKAQERAGGVIEAARQAELGGLRSATGMTRAQIEERQFQISQQIFQLEEQKEAQLTRVTELQDDIYNKTQLLEIEQRKIRDLEDQIYAKEVARQAALDKLVPLQEKLTGLENQRAAALEKIAEKEDAIAKIKNSEAYKAALKAVADAEAELKKAQDAKADIEKKLRDALAKVDEQQAKWEDVKAGIEAAQGAVTDFEGELAKAKTAADVLAKAISAMIIADQNITGTDVFGTGQLNTSTLTNDPNFDETGFKAKIFANRNSNAATGAVAKPTGTTATATTAKNLADAAKNAPIVKEALGKIADFSKLSAADQEKITNAIISQAEQLGLIKPNQDGILLAVQGQVEPTTNISNFLKLSAEYVKGIFDYITQTNPLAEALVGIFEKMKSVLDAVITKIQSYVSSLSTALSTATALSAQIASLNRTVVTTHIIRTVYETSGSTGNTGTTGLNKMYGGKIKGYAGGGMIKPLYRPMGGLIPYMANGGFKSMGSDTVPGMLTPGEFVVNRESTKAFGPLLSAINDAKYPSMIARKFSEVSPSMMTTSLISPSYNISSPTVNASNTNIANASYSDNSSAVYNYNVGITVGGTNASPSNIAQTVMNEIRYLDSQRVKKQRVS